MPPLNMSLETLLIAHIPLSLLPSKSINAYIYAMRKVCMISDDDIELKPIANHR